MVEREGGRCEDFQGKGWRNARGPLVDRGQVFYFSRGWAQRRFRKDLPFSSRALVRPNKKDTKQLDGACFFVKGARARVHVCVCEVSCGSSTFPLPLFVSPKLLARAKEKRRERQYDMHALSTTIAAPRPCFCVCAPSFLPPVKHVATAHPHACSSTLAARTAQHTVHTARHTHNDDAPSFFRP